MLRTFRRTSHPNALRRLLAVLLAFLVLGTVAEPLIAEAHDGDAPGMLAPSASGDGPRATTQVVTWVVATTPVDRAGVQAAAHAVVADEGMPTGVADTWDAARDADRAGPAAVAPGRAGASISASVPSSPAPLSSGGSHGMHVCHCAHAHGGLPALPYVVSTRVRRVVPARTSRSDRLPASSPAEPRLRPPVLPHAA